MKVSDCRITTMVGGTATDVVPYAVAEELERKLAIVTKALNVAIVSLEFIADSLEWRQRMPRLRSLIERLKEMV